MTCCTKRLARNVVLPRTAIKAILEGISTSCPSGSRIESCRYCLTGTDFHEVWGLQGQCGCNRLRIDNPRCQVCPVTFRTAGSSGASCPAALDFNQGAARCTQSGAGNIRLPHSCSVETVLILISASHSSGTGIKCCRN